MSFKERLNREKDNHSAIILFNDRGLFYNVLERSAYAFHTRIRPFKVHVKTLKDLDDPFVSIGVPVAQKDTYLKFLNFTTDDQGNVTAQLDKTIDEKDFQEWKKHILDNYNEKKEKAEKTFILEEQIEDTDKQEENIILRQCFQEVKTLNIASMTPMEAMLYLNSLQQKLKNVEL